MTAPDEHAHGIGLDLAPWRQDTVLFAGLLALILVFLAARVIRLRVRHRVGIGDGGQPDLARAIRVHGNFVEYTPLGLLLILLIELAGYAPWLVQTLGGALVAGRLLHALGLSRSSGESMPRLIGMVLTFAVLVVGGGLCLLAWVEGFLPAD